MASRWMGQVMQRGPPRPRPSSAPLTVMTRSEAPQLQVGPVHDRLPQRADLRIHAMARHRCLRLDEALDGLGGFGAHGLEALPEAGRASGRGGGCEYV